MKLYSFLKYGVTGLIILLIGIGVAVISWDGDGEPSEQSTISKKDSTRRPKRQAERRTGKKKGRKLGQRASTNEIKLESRPKPSMSLEDEEERELTELARKVLASLQAALDSEDYTQIRQILEMVQRAPKGALGKHSEGMPVALRKKIIEAVGWFGALGIPEITGFLADEDPNVVQMALDQFEMALNDISLGDRERAKIVSMASTVLTDKDALEQIFMEISNMRNSVAANTIFTICQDGTPQAKELIVETMEFVTGEDTIQTVEDLEKWVAEHPDDPDDDDLYGPMDVDSTDD